MASTDEAKEIRSEYVVITDPSGETMEIPTNEDNSIFVTTLQATISGATGLKYKNPKTGASRAVAVDPTGTKLLPPSDGWEDKVFQVIIATVRGSDVSVKRRKMGDSDGEEDCEGEGRLMRKRALESGPVERRPVDLIVLGISYKTADEVFKAYFEQFGTVVFAEVKKSHEGSSKGFGFVQMATIEEQDKILGVHQHVIDGRRCDVKVPDQRTPFGQRFESSPRRNATSKIFVGRLTDKLDEGVLREFFETEAKKINEGSMVQDVFIPKPFRGFAFVTFSHTDVAEKICKQTNIVIDGVSVAVSLAVPRDETPNNGYGFNEYGYAYGYAKGGAGYNHPYKADYGYASPPPMASPYSAQWASPPPRTPPRGPPPHPQWMSTPRGTPRGRGASSPAYPSQPIGTPHAYMKGPDNTGNQLTNGIGALNINQKNPEAFTAAWNAFVTTLHASGHQSPYPPPNGWQH